jgi:phosphate transport system protein
VPRGTFDRALHELEDDLLILGFMAEKAVYRSVEALKKRDLKAAEQIIADDAKVDQKRIEIEERCIELTATQQPMAGDLRLIVAILNLIVELERIGDYAEGIAKITLLLGDEPPLKPLIDVPRMADKARDMLRRSLNAFIERDEETAKKICAEDDEVDELYNQVYRELLTFMLADPKTINRATHLLWVAHNLERIADRVTNICERVVFLKTGKLEGIVASKY